MEPRTEDVERGIQGTDEGIWHGLGESLFIGKKGRRKGVSSPVDLQGQRQEPESMPTWGFDFLLQQEASGQFTMRAAGVGVRDENGGEDYREITSSQVFEIYLKKKNLLHMNLINYLIN